MARGKKIRLLRLTPFDEYKLRRVEEMIERDHINPRRTEIISSDGEMKFTPADIRNYHMKHSTGYDAVIGKGNYPWLEKTSQAV